MTDRKKHFLFSIVNIVLFFICILIYSSPVISLKIGKVNPMLPLALLVAFSMFSSELSAALAGLTIGIFIDSVSSTPAGFNSILLFIIALAISLTARYLFNNNVLANIALCLLSTALYYLARWTFCFAVSLSFTESLIYLMRYALPSVIYTAVFTVPFYYFEKFLRNKLYITRFKVG